MSEELAAGRRVKISKDYHWAKSATGEITEPPNIVVELSDGWSGIVRNVSSLNGNLLFYWVKFDESQIDADGNDYHEAEIGSNYLSLLAENT